MRRTGIFLLLIVLSTAIAGQSYGFSYSVDDLVRESDVLVEAEIIDLNSYFGQDGLIYTEYTLNVYNLFKGEIDQETISFHSVGGVVGDEGLMVCPALHCAVGQTGVFGVRASSIHGGEFVPTSADKSMIIVDYQSNTGTDFNARQYRLRDLRDQLQTKCGQNITTWKSIPSNELSESAVTISSISPLSTYAGRGSVITINGSGFGSTRGNGEVRFQNANSLATLISQRAYVYTEWTNTRIKVICPNGAGSGSIVVVDNNGMQSAPSAQQLSISYNISNYGPNPLHHIDDAGDGDGGYRFQYSNNTSHGGVDFSTHTAAIAAVERATTTWNNVTGWAIFTELACGTTSAQAPANDGVNMITFDNDMFSLNRYGTSVVGVCFYSFSLCGSSEWEITDIDLVMRRDGMPVNWEFGPGAPSGGEIDFESVVLHEFGHGRGLGHTLASSSAVMYPVIYVGSSRRVLSTHDSGGGNYFQGISLGYNPPTTGGCPGPRQYLAYSSSNRCSAALPLELISFEGSVSERNVLLSWSTANEIHHDEIILQRSVSKDDWMELEAFEGQGARGQYTYVDEDLDPGVYYYRLEIKDDHGHSEFSKIIAVEIVPGDKGVTTLIRQGRLDLSVIGLGGNDLRIDVHDLNGRLLHHESFRVDQNFSSNTIFTQNWVPGAYVLSWTNLSTGHRESSKIFVP